MNSTREQLIFSGESYERFLLEKISYSTKNIFISCYILEADEFGDRIIKALVKKAQEGVNVRLIVDGLGSRNWINGAMSSCKQKNFDIRIYHPLILAALRFGLDPFTRWNRRNHQKLFIFDREIAMIGSRNINNDALTWRETNIVIEGPCIEVLVTLFNDIWKLSHNRFFHRYYPIRPKAEMLRIRGSDRIFTNHRFSLRRKMRQINLQKIQNAKLEIQITTPYFFPTRKIFKALLQKALSGVTVEVLLPKVSDIFISKWISQDHYGKLLKAGVKIYEYQPAILHSKSMIIDDWAVIGSSNFNRRSVLRDMELDYVVGNPETMDQLKKQGELDKKNSVLIESIPHLSIGKKILVWIATTLFPSWF